MGDQQVAVRFNRNLNQNQSQNYNYLEDARPGGFQSFGILTTDFRPLTVENIQETSTPPPEVTDPVPPPVTDEEPITPADPTLPSEPPTTGNEPGSGDTGSDNNGGSGSAGSGSGSGGQSGNGDAATGTGGTDSGKTLLETILSSDVSEVKAVNLSTTQAAQAAVVSTSEAIDFVKNLRSNLEVGVRELGSIMVGHEVHSKALTDSSGRIQDAATAQQAALQAQQQILDQTTLAVSGMANTDNRAVLSLLKGPESSFIEIPYQFPREDQDKKEAEQQVNQTPATNKDEEDQEPLYQYPRETDEQEQQQPQRQAPVQTSAEQNVA